MYEAHYGLTGKPFQLNPDPSFYFGSKQHRRAMAYLEYGVHQNEGFIVVTGEVGAGKTTLVRGLLDKLDPNQVVAAHLVSTQLDAEDILCLVGAAFGVRSKGVSKSEVLMSLEAFLVGLAAQKKRCLLIVDEAQNLTPRAVEELRMLSNFQLGPHSVLQTFLIGQPEFREILQGRDMLQLRQRVIAACHVNPMDAEETRGYIEHRLKCAGAKGSPSFDDGAFAEVFAVSGGVPRRINTLCDRLLLHGFLVGKQTFTRDDVREVAHEIESEGFVASRGTAGASGAPMPTAGQPSPEGTMAGLDIDARTAREADAMLTALRADQVGARLSQLERSLLRIERINSATLALMQRLVQAARDDSSGEGQ